MHSLTNVPVKTTNLVKILWYISMFKFQFDSPKASREMITSRTNLIQELTRKLLNYLRTCILGNYKI